MIDFTDNQAVPSPGSETAGFPQEGPWVAGGRGLLRSPRQLASPLCACFQPVRGGGAGCAEPCCTLEGTVLSSRAILPQIWKLLPFQETCTHPPCAGPAEGPWCRPPHHSWGPPKSGWLWLPSVLQGGFWPMCRCLPPTQGRTSLCPWGTPLATAQPHPSLIHVVPTAGAVAETRCRAC